MRIHGRSRMSNGLVRVSLVILLVGIMDEADVACSFHNVNLVETGTRLSDIVS